MSRSFLSALRHFAAAAFLLLAGCTATGSQPAVQLGRHATPYANAPYGVTVSPNFSPWVDTGTRYTADQVRQTIRQETGVIPRITDGTYTTVSAQWLRDNLPLFAAWMRANVPHYNANAFDCENFTRVTREILAAEAGRAGIGASPLAAELNVFTRAAWGGVPASEGAHALTGIETDEGRLVIEPQSLPTGRVVWCLWQDYPNRRHLFAILF